MKQQLKKKLLVYSSIGSVITMISEQSQGQVVYFDPPDIVISGGTYDLDLNNDGVYDFRFYDGPNASTYKEIVFNGYDQDIQILQGSDCDFYLEVPRIIQPGQVIKRNPAGDWLHISYSEDAAMFCQGDPSCSYLGWKGKKNKFFAFRFKDHPGQSNFNYGWMRVSVSPNCHTLKIHDWAYNSEPGATIVAGETQRIGAVVIPEERDELQVYAAAKILYIDNNLDEELLTISIFNLSGQRLNQMKTSQPSVGLDLQAFPAGMFLVHIKGNNTNHSWKIVLE